MALRLQMTWQAHLIKKRKSGAPLGLKNLGNTCYLNSVLQCLTYTPPLANFCLKLQHTTSCDSAGQQDKRSECPFCLLEKRIVRSLSVDHNLDTPGKILNSLKIFAEHFRLGRQEDAHEFLRYVIDACHTTCLRLKKLQQPRKFANGGGEDVFGGSTVVKEIFGGALQSQVKCLSCGIESNKVDEIMDVSLDVLNSGSLKEAFQKFFQSEILDGNNKYKCDNCKKLVAARKQMSILQAPNILVVQLKRFGGSSGGKIDKAIAFEEVLVLSSFMCKGSQDLHPEYNLFATIVHSGFSPDSGHYYAYIKDAIGCWYCCNDSYVSLSNLQEVVSEKVYILFFSRTKQRPLPANKTISTNGTKSYTCNGGSASKILNAGHALKPVDSPKYIEHQPQKDKSTSKEEKLPTCPDKELISSGNSGTRKVPTNVNGKVIVYNKDVNGNNGDIKASSCIEKSEKLPLSKDANGFCESKVVQKIQPLALMNENGKIHSNGIDVVVDGCERNDTRNGTAVVSGPRPLIQDRCVKSPRDNLDFKRKLQEEEPRTLVGNGPSFHQVQNDCAKSHPDNSGPKRKLKETNTCILFAEDAQLQAKREELKEALEKEASSVLRSCGWSDEVYHYMCSKKLCVREKCDIASSNNELKRLLIADAKSKFTSRIPESLKANLVKHLMSFSKEKRAGS